MATLLLVDDEPSIVKVLATYFGQHDIDTVSACSAEEALAQMENCAADLMLVDLRLGAGMDGLELMHECRARHPHLPVIMMTAYGTVEVAVEAMREGAYDFICKPFELEDLGNRVREALAQNGVRPHASVAGDPGMPARHFGSLIGESPDMLRLYQIIERVGKTDATVLIQGESGTGKELVARAIHRVSRRSSGPWVPLNCAAIPDALLESELFGHVAGSFTGATANRDGMFMAAEGGTLFLDEIGVMDIGLQGKLLRVLQEGKVRRVGENRDRVVNVRVVAATNEQLQQKMAAGGFREDLFYRISVIPVQLCPLRRRKEDIPLLARWFCDEQSKALGIEVEIGDEALACLVGYSWPGNVREFQNAIACAATLCEGGNVTPADLPPHISAQPPSVEEMEDLCGTTRGELGKSLREFLRGKEQQYMAAVLERTGGNRARAADLLGISRATLYRKLPDEADA